LTAALATLAQADLIGQEPAAEERTDPVRTYERTFADIKSAAELSDGRLVVVDGIEQSVLVLDPDGVGSRQVGRSGRGPAEYVEPWNLIPLSGDSTLIYDIGQMKLLLVAPDESVLADGRWPVTTGAVPAGLDGAGRFVFDERGKVVTDRAGRVDESPAPLIRLDAVTGAADTITTLEVRSLATRWEASPVSRMFRPGPGGFARFRLSGSPFGGQDEWVALPDGRIAVARLEPLRVEIFDSDGELMQGPPVPYGPIEVTGADRQAWTDASLRGQAGGATGSFQMDDGSSRPIRPPEPELADSDFPAVKPPFPWHGLHASPDGRLWLQRYGEHGAAHTEVDEFDERGTLVRRVLLPPDRELIAVGREVLYAVRYDEMDVQFVEAYAR
jgi:hypothetical protein